MKKWIGQPDVCVVGSSNIDLLTKAPRLPRMGETLIGHRFHMGFGGKGANQSVMAAKLGANVTMVTKLGKDMFGEATYKNFKDQGIDTKYIFWDEERFSGVAPIFVDDDGNNFIVIVPGANWGLLTEDVLRAGGVIEGADVVICQLEVPLETTAEALRIAKKGRALTVFNPAPGSPLPAELFSFSDVIAPNEVETEAILGKQIKSMGDAETAINEFLDRGSRVVIVTLGERGAMVGDEAGIDHIPTIPVKSVDTTGAGDAFIGTLAYYLAIQKPVREAVYIANIAAALSVTKIGTQTSFPSKREVEERYGREKERGLMGIEG